LRSQIEESREALSQKIEMLEEKVTETVQSATASVTEATANVLETVQTATASVSETVDSVTHAFQGTVDTVRQSVEGTVDSVKDAFDFSAQVERHPWLMLGGAVAAGYLGATLLSGSGNSANKMRRSPRRHARIVAGNGDMRLVEPLSEASNPGSIFNDAAMVPQFQYAAEGPKKAGWLERLGEALAPEFGKLEGLAIGTALGTVRDFVVEATPTSMRPQVKEIIDSLTEKMGGQKVPEHLFEEACKGSSTP